VRPDDVFRLPEAVRGRLPDLRTGYLTPNQFAEQVDDDGRGPARRLL
jgi:hypothetical protein